VENSPSVNSPSERICASIVRERRVLGCARHVPITLLYELEDFEMALLVTIGTVAHNSLAFAECSFTEALERTLRTRAGFIDDDVSLASDRIVNAFLADKDLHRL